MFSKIVQDKRGFVFGLLLALAGLTSCTTTERHMIGAKAAGLVGGASKVADDAAPGGYLISLAQPGQGVKFSGLPAAGKLAIRYASVTNGHDQRRGQRPAGAQ